jgi:hypothetical protein
MKALDILAVIAMVIAAGCKLGGTWESAVIDSPLGATVEIRNDEGTREAELLLVQTDGIVVLVDRQVRLARWGDMNRLAFRRVPVYGLVNGYEPGVQQHDAMRKVSRYPRGLTEAQLAALLASYGQSEIVVYR